ncbi:hypothetical protein RND71_009603 [Anisodus tanguticus]|uniref:Uncharacterized protein n=1 Tax=Anisodus tanguticus TaxID=243964 RepID=A0AAE1SIR7_9SOLA|nr:hypothetical protein RND71_009603 [Anisodus tanguticus]
MERDHADVITPGKMDQNDSEPADLNKVNSKVNSLRVSTSRDITETPTQKPAKVTSSAEQENQIREDEETHGENAQKQLVLYDPDVAGAGAASTAKGKRPHARRNSLANYTSRAADVGAFAVQCARCFKWRYMPTKEKYEEIREHILEQPFYCETTREWCSDKSCDDPPDLTQDGSRLWAIDKPNISLPPPGWERLLRIRAEGGTKFADVYYVTPSGERLRSMVKVRKYLEQHPEYVARGVEEAQFSFEVPRPLQEGYVKKRSAPSRDINSVSDVNPISWAAPEGNTGLLGGPVPSAPSDAAPLDVPDGNSPKKPKLMGESDSVVIA